MRRQVEISRNDKLGIIGFSLFWLIALTALSASAHGREINDTTSKPAIAANQAVSDKPAATSIQPIAPVETTSADSTGIKTDEITRYILISIPDRQLALVDDGQIVKVYPIAIGAPGTPSPTGDYTIISHVADPVYQHEGKTVLPGKSNPVGSRWMGLSLKGYGIHGTNVQSSIGKAASHGCFRMKRKDVEELFTLVKVGDIVSIHGERDELVAAVFGEEENSAEVKVAKNTGAPDATAN
ncbi:MAG TPA: L,D-transpeptidase [Candidatus Saccharimonadales bacterium]|jgi:lipoprotein-anchoring transpeptidase ErfK/SrfK|nr:L,D-transpeptidase [Candidatus Saccharimonadales bacterium]